MDSKKEMLKEIQRLEFIMAVLKQKASKDDFKAVLVGLEALELCTKSIRQKAFKQLIKKNKA